jgi:hypothetical protein
MKSTTAIRSDGGRVQAAASSNGSASRAVCTAIAVALLVWFVGLMSRYYHPRTGFTSLIGFPAGHDYEVPAMRGVPHDDYTGAGVYDGQYYAQLALDPLLRDPRTDRAMDLAPFRARRILFSWTAYLAGLGRPAWILETYALQNVVAWFVLAWLLVRWMPPSTPRGLAAWTACLFSHGLLWSVRFSLLDGPSLALTAVAVRLAEDGRTFLSAAVAGINVLGRETNAIGGLAQPLPRSRRDWLHLAAMAIVVVLPILIWEDYLRSIYRSTIFAGADMQTSLPGVQFASALVSAAEGVWRSGVFSAAALDVCVLVPLLVQAVYIVTRLRRAADAWWRVALGYVLLLLVLDKVLVAPSTGAITRVMLPLTVGFNALLAREAKGPRFWSWLAAGNLHVIPAMWIL